MELEKSGRPVGGRVAVVVLTLLGAMLVLPSPAGAVINTAATAQQIAEAIAVDPGVVTSASFQDVPPSGTPNAVSDTALTSFPTAGSTYGILTTGNADFADDANDANDTGAALGGPNVRGDTDFDVTVLEIDLQVPDAVNCLAGIQFRFLSDEFPEFVNSSFNDAFIAELDTSTWTTAGSTITAPDNFAFDPSGDVISINTTGATAFSAEAAAGTTYDGATPLLTAATPITPGAHTLFLSIFDQGDQIYDSAVFLDSLTFTTVANLEEDCVPGAEVAPPTTAPPTTAPPTTTPPTTTPPTTTPPTTTPPTTAPPAGAPNAPSVEALAGWHAATFTITPGAGGSPATAYEVTLRDGITVVDTATVDADDDDLSVTFGDLDTGTTYTATVVATNGAGDSAPATATATPFVPADTTGLTIARRACPDGTSITWTVDNDLDIPVSFDWIAKTAATSGTDVVEANSSTQVTTDFDGPNRNVFRVIVDRILQDRTQSLRAEFCNPVMTPI